MPTQRLLMREEQRFVVRLTQQWQRHARERFGGALFRRRSQQVSLFAAPESPSVALLQIVLSRQSYTAARHFARNNGCACQKGAP